MRYAESYIRLKNGRYTKSQLEIESGRYNLSVEETSYTVTSLKVGIKYSEATRISSRNLKTIQERRLLYLLLGSARCRLSTTQGTTKQPARVCRPLSALQTTAIHTHILRATIQALRRQPAVRATSRAYALPVDLPLSVVGPRVRAPPPDFNCPIRGCRGYQGCTRLKYPNALRN